MTPTSRLTSEISNLAKVEDRFLDLAKALRSLHNALTPAGGVTRKDLFNDIIRQAGVKRRKAYYLIMIDEALSRLKLSEDRLQAIGWTKLMLIADRLTQQSAEHLLGLAEKNTVEGLRAKLAQEDPPSRVMTFRLTEAQYKTIAEALLANGAEPAGPKSLKNKEEALVALCSRAIRQQ